jgi:hydroxymethylglutaryl-CoA lyase
MPGWTESYQPIRWVTPTRHRSTEVVLATHDAIGPVLYGLHLHDTCGLGIANAVPGLEVKIGAFGSCLAGLGGCRYAPGASGNLVTEDLVFMPESMGFTTGIAFRTLLESRKVLHTGLPAEPLQGRVPKVRSRRTFREAA